jgi:hypothetical protein
MSADDKSLAYAASRTSEDGSSSAPAISLENPETCDAGHIGSDAVALASPRGQAAASRREGTVNSGDSALVQAEALAQQHTPEPQPEPASSGAGFGLGKSIIGGVALLLVGAIAVGLLPVPGLGPPPQPLPVPLAIEQPVTQPISGPSLIRPVPAAELQRAIDATQLSDSEKARLRIEVVGKTRLGWVTVSDSVEEDGDWVIVSSGGFQQDIRLFHRPTTIAVPYTPGVPATVTGKIDGGGGITVAVHVGASIFPLAPMQVGTSVQVPTP